MEQVAVVIRFVHESYNKIEVREEFLGFLAAKETTGEALS